MESKHKMTEMSKRRCTPALVLILLIACLLFALDAPADSIKDSSVDGEAAAAGNPAVRVCSLAAATCRIPSLHPQIAPTYPAGCAGVRSFRICSGASFAVDEYIPRTCWVQVTARWNLPNDKTPSVSPVPGVLICP